MQAHKYFFLQSSDAVRDQINKIENLCTSIFFKKDLFTKHSLSLSQIL